MLTSPWEALGLCAMCISHTGIAHAGMLEPCLLFTLSCFVCVHDHVHV